MCVPICVHIWSDSGRYLSTKETYRDEQMGLWCVLVSHLKHAISSTGTALE